MPEALPMPGEPPRRFFNEALLRWHEGVQRPMPWKGSGDPYAIWLSEVITQQTRVEQASPYYQRFINRFPDIFALASAHLEEVLKLWEGLGYYARARHLHQSARDIVARHAGRFPDAYADIRRLKGVGDYTAAAIASFAFQLPHAAVDGNVLRILSRFFGLALPIDTVEGKKYYTALAQALLPHDRPGAFNQAMMDLGALVCTPQNPHCARCPLVSQCEAHRQGRARELPRKSKKIARRNRYFQYLVLECEDQVALRRRNSRDIWKLLHEFPLLEGPSLADNADSLLADSLFQRWTKGVDFVARRRSKTYRQTLTHQNIFAAFWEIELAAPPPDLPSECFWTPRRRLPDYAFPKIIRCYFQDKSLSLDIL
jgi:A/G-specific adenine glycosylase